MSCRVNHLNKKTGVTYVYESVSIWDKEKQQSRSKQICIGKIDSSTGELIPSQRLHMEAPAEAVQKAEPSIATAAAVGPSLILDALSERLGIAKILKTVFPEFHAQILTMAYYLAVHGGPLSQCASLQELQRYYGSIRPCAPHRYSPSCRVLRLRFSLHIGTTGSHVSYNSPVSVHAALMPEVVRPVSRFPGGLFSQRND